MRNINTRKWSTPMIIGAGLFVAVSGILMFFHVAGPLELAHEWIGLVFALGILLHLLNHWSAFKNYFRQQKALGVMALVLMATGSLVITAASEGGGNPMMQLVRSVEAAPLSEVATLLDQDADGIVAKFLAAGFQVGGSEKSIIEIAIDNGVEPRALISVLYRE